MKLYIAYKNPMCHFEATRYGPNVKRQVSRNDRPNNPILKHYYAAFEKKTNKKLN